MNAGFDLGIMRSNFNFDICPKKLHERLMKLRVCFFSRVRWIQHRKQFDTKASLSNQLGTKGNNSCSSHNINQTIKHDVWFNEDNHNIFDNIHCDIKISIKSLFDFCLDFYQ